MKHFRIRKHDDFQHYKNRNPPWIMLHLKLFGSQDFLALSDGAKWQALALALIASRYDNHLPENPKWLKDETHSKQPIDLEALFTAKFIVWCRCDACASTLQQDASNLQQIAAHRRGEQSKGEQSRQSSSDDPLQAVFQAYIQTRERHYAKVNGTKPPSTPALTPTIRDKIKAAIRVHGYDKALAAGQGLFLSKHHLGENDRNTPYLQPTHAWRMPNKSGKGPDNVDTFSELYFVYKARHG